MTYPRDEPDNGFDNLDPELPPPLLGGDTELGNFIESLDAPNGTGRWASQLLLMHIDGIPSVAPFGSRAAVATDSIAAHSVHNGGHGVAADSANAAPPLVFDAQDWGHKFLSTTGGSAYIDLDHIELPLPEVRSAQDYLAAWYASIRIARDARDAANAQLPGNLRVQVLANNSDGLGHSYGGHVNVLISRRTFDDLFHYRLQNLVYLGSYQASSIVFAGQGKVGSENGAPPVDFQLSQRADFIETLCGTQTTYRRPLVNSRDEPLCGNSKTHDAAHPARRLARLHVIFYDSLLCQVATYLKVAVLQLIVVLIGQKRIDNRLLLDNPVESLWSWSHDPTLKRKAKTLDGEHVTAVEHQFLYLEQAEGVHESGGFDNLVPDAGVILRLWREVLQHLQSHNFEKLFGAIDWVTKQEIIQRALASRSDLDWDSPQIKHLDHCYSNIDPAEGLYWAYADNLAAPRIASNAQIERFTVQPPEDTRAWTRAMLLRLAGPGRVEAVDWDRIKFRCRDESGRSVSRVLEMPNPLGMGCAESGHFFSPEAMLDEVLTSLGASDAESEANHSQSNGNYDYGFARAGSLPDLDRDVTGRSDTDIRDLS